MRKPAIKHVVMLTLAFVLTTVLCALKDGLISEVVSAQNAPPLDNPRMEDGFRPVDGVGELEVANGWMPWWLDGPGLKRPEYKAETRTIGAGRVLEGKYAQKQFTTYSAHDGGVYQEIHGVTVGACYRFAGNAYVWSSDQDNPNVSTHDGKYSALVGVNPWGDNLGGVRTTVWGKEALQVYNQWVHVEVTAQAWAPKITVFTRGVAVWGVKHNDSYWDSFSLSEVPCAGSPQATSTPRPTYTPLPTYTPAPPGKDCLCPSLEDIRAMVREELRAVKVEIK
jgi:hypothetical protein